MSECYKRLILRAADALKPMGYKRGKGFLVTRSGEGNYGFISFIDDKRASQDDITHFTIEVSVSSQKLLERFKGIYRSGKAVPQENDYSRRLGYLIGCDRDIWWDICTENYELVTTETIERLLNYGVPEVDNLISDQAICSRRLTAFEQGHRTNIEVLNGLAFLLKELGDLCNFSKVATFIFDTFGERPFGSDRTVADFLVELGFSPDHPTQIPAGPGDPRFHSPPK